MPLLRRRRARTDLDRGLRVPVGPDPVRFGPRQFAHVFGGRVAADPNDRARARARVGCRPSFL